MSFLPHFRAFALAVTVAATAAPAFAAPSDQALAFVTELGDEAVKIVSNPALKGQDFETTFRAFIDKGFDLDTIGRFALGNFAKAITPAQNAEYQKLFHDYIVHTYANRFQTYSGESFKVGTARVVAADEALVSSTILRPGNQPAIKIDWQVRVTGGKPKIIDIVIEGLRLGITLRDEFAGVIRQGGGNFEALLKVLREKAAA